ncbi:T9SS type A sorting domain-containing protein [Parabacteroides sp. Marseille-P3160]|uniref:T9SS type A sorting domain-containing protein n=1 Tax=Parabacteroides sp. Marseille-P3160 TaxID=1917887 RepID=UPI0009BBF6F2|nr:T9SS type A sorting domain-containing protein [Parabacteroides sp. Marseille-P3160]
MNKRRITLFLIFCISHLLIMQTVLAADRQTIEGGKWEIVYHNDSKTCDYVYSGKTILAGVFVQAKNKNQFIQSTEYAAPTFTQENITDVFGSGVKHTITYSGQEGQPDLQQVFYFYPDKDYFLTEASIVSAEETSSNYIAPIVTSTVSSFLNNDDSNRILSVPFDNDAWVGYSAFPLEKDSVSFEVTAVYNGKSREGLVLGSVEHDTWKTGIRYAVSKNQQINKLECFGGITHSLTRDVSSLGVSIPHGAISGTKLKSPKLLVGWFGDWRKGLDTYGEANALVTPPRKWEKGNVFGWNSWGAMAEHLNYTGALDVSDYIKTNLQSKGFHNNGDTYVILDSYWDNLNETQLQGFVNRCVANGQIPGIYWSPFSDWGENGQRTMEGSNTKYEDAYLYANGEIRKIASRALDPTHPGTRLRMDYFIKMFKRLGFKYIKLDFLNNGILEADSYYDKEVTTGVQAYNEGMQYLADLCGEDMFLALSIAPAFPSQYGNSRRISCDAWGAKEDSEYVMNSLSFGWWLDKVYPYNDGDHLVLYKDSYSESENRTRITSGVITGTYILGDNFSQKGTYTGNPEARTRAEKYATNADINAIAQIGKSFFPIEGYLASGTNSWGRNRGESLFMLNAGQYIYVAIFNFSSEMVSGTVDLSRLGIFSSQIKEIKELWFDRIVTLQGEALSYMITAGDTRVYRLEKNENATDNQAIKAVSGDMNGWTTENRLFLNTDKPLENISLFSTQGILVKRQKVYEQQAQHEINISGLPKGIYIVQAVTTSKEVESLKFVRR